MNVLITGAGGQLGHDTVLVCTAAGDTVTGLDHATLDVTSRDAVLGAVTSVRPDAVIHCAAWTAVDACESDPDRAYAANALAVRWMAEACRRTGAHLVTVSTDYVFDGEQAEPYTEWDTPNPTSVYGASKLAGEREALALGAGAAIARTSWVCGEYGNNMVKTIMRLAGERDSLAFVDDQVGHPSLCADLAPALRRLALDRRSGVHHVTNQGRVSWFEFAQAVVTAMGKPADMVAPIATVDLQPPRPAKRPANSVLDNAVMRLGGLPLLPDFRGSLQALVDRLLVT
ncbi:MAG: dTDP-4-dehydrorhamnose reductase [Ilumatobacteraceae bacterium]|nr:dTDP-4-dehydrorhamnose reductase [Ilumatobacteraceae bacterium]